MTESVAGASFHSLQSVSGRFLIDRSDFYRRAPLFRRAATAVSTGQIAVTGAVRWTPIAIDPKTSAIYAVP